MQKSKRLSIDELKENASLSVIKQNLDVIKGGMAAGKCHVYTQNNYYYDDCQGGRQEKYTGEMQ